MQARLFLSNYMYANMYTGTNVDMTFKTPSVDMTFKTKTILTRHK